MTVLTLCPFLTSEENDILADWSATSSKPKISTATSLRLYELFLQGSSMQEIVDANNGAFSMGQVLNARVVEKWDERKKSHLDHLYGTIVQRVAQVQSEGIAFIADAMAMQHKMYGAKIKKYLQSGDEDDLRGMPPSYMTADGYRKLIDALMRVTGQDKQKSTLDERVPRPGPETEREVGINIPMKALPPGTTPAVDMSTAAKILQALDKMGIGDD